MAFMKTLGSVAGSGSLGLLLMSAACSSSPPASCNAGQTVACTCFDGQSGAQVCSNEGRFGDCNCSRPDMTVVDFSVPPDLTPPPPPVDMTTVVVPPHRFAFVTKTAYFPAQLSAPTQADSLCTTAAQGALLPGTYKAWVSFSYSGAYVRMADSLAWYMAPQGAENGVGPRVFNNRSGLLSGPLTTFDRDEFGTTKPATTLVWTGTSATGVASSTCNDWASNTSTYAGTLGSVAKTDQAGRRP